MSRYTDDDAYRRPRSPDYTDRRPSSRDSFERESMHLEPAPRYSSRSRTRSVPPDGREMVRQRSPSLAYSDYDDDATSRTLSVSRSTSYSRDGRSDYYDDGDDEQDENGFSVRKARNVMQTNFSNSTAGIGAGLVGALAGGYAAREVSERFVENRRRAAEEASHGSSSRPGSSSKSGSRNSGSRPKRSSSETERDEERIRLATTIIGAAIGGLGANALTKRYESSRDVNEVRRRAWDDSYGRDERPPSYHSERRGSSRRAIEDYDDDYYSDDYERPYDRRHSQKQLQPY